jgi:hypothetical protein
MSPVNDDEFAMLSRHANRIVSHVFEIGFESLSDAEKIFFLVWIADGQINNGGFHSVCCESTGDYAYLFPNAYRAIGAESLAEIFEDLIVAFGNDGIPNDQPTRYRAHCELDDTAVLNIDVLDNRYFDGSHCIHPLLVRWVGQFNGSGEGA